MQAIGERVRKFMSDKIQYTDEPMEIGKFVDILPTPAELAEMARTERATLTLTKATLDYFRTIAAKENVPYNQLIRNALDEYVKRNFDS